METFTSCGSDTHLRADHNTFARKPAGYSHTKHGSRRHESSIVQKHNMTRFYVSDDVESDVRRCIRSWEYRRAITVNGRTMTGETRSFSGTVEAVARAPSAAAGDLWLVTMRETGTNRWNPIQAMEL
jgi:hypothetical protein